MVLSAISLAFLVLLVVYDASVRYLFHSGSIALQELEWHLFDVVILLSIAYALQKNVHVRVDIFYDKFPFKIKEWVNIFSALFFILPISLLVIYVGLEFVQLSFMQLEASSNPGGLPYRFIVKSIMPLAFILLLLQAFSEVLHAFKRLKEHQ